MHPGQHGQLWSLPPRRPKLPPPGPHFPPLPRPLLPFRSVFSVTTACILILDPPGPPFPLPRPQVGGAVGGDAGGGACHGGGHAQ